MFAHQTIASRASACLLALSFAACSPGTSSPADPDAGLGADADATVHDAQTDAPSDGGELPDFIAVSDDQRGFVHSRTGEPFVPYGVNYSDRSTGGHRMLEELWDTEWATIEEDFADMRAMHYEVVRINPQIAWYMSDRDTPIDDAFDKLVAIADLAEANGLHLNITGLAAFRAEETPAWYDSQSEADRWETQANFWKETARRLRDHPAVFVYSLMNEPVVFAEPQPAGKWFLGEIDGLQFTQLISLDVGERTPQEVAAAWMAKLTEAIRSEDPNHLVTVGNLPFLMGGFAPENVAPYVDFLSVHVYPETENLNRSLAVVDGFQQGKPVVIEETFPLFCSTVELRWFMGETLTKVAGYTGFYFGIPRAQLMAGAGGGAGVLTLATLEAFEDMRADIFSKKPRALPVHQYWSSAQTDHYYTVARNDAGYALFGYTHDEVEAAWAVESFKTEGTTALCTPVDPDVNNHTVTFDCAAGTPAAAGALLGWVRTAPAQGYVPLHEYRSGTTDDTVLTVVQNDAAFGMFGYEHQGVLAYVREVP